MPLEPGLQRVAVVVIPHPPLHLLRLHRKIRLVARNYHYRHIEPRQNHSESHRLDYKDRRLSGGGRL